MAGSVFTAALLLAAASAAAQGSPEAQADSAVFTINTTESTEGGTQVAADSGVFVLDTTGTAAAQADSVDFVIDTRSGPVAFSLLNPVALSGGGFQFNFTNSVGASFRVFGATNLETAFSNWVFLGTVTDAPPGFYAFSDWRMTNCAQRFYRVVSP